MNKKRTIITTSIFAILILSFMIIGFIKKGDILYSTENIEVGAGEYEKIIANQIALKRGIYRIDVDYVCNTEYSDMYISFLTPRDQSVSKDKLRSTGGYLYLNKTFDYQEFYLYENTDKLYIELTAYYDDFTIESLKITDTGKLWFCGAFIVLIAYILFWGIVTVYCGVKNKSLTQDKFISIIALSIIWLVTSTPILCGYTVLTADGPYHMERVEGIANAIKAGIIPVRIEPSWLQGYGYGNGLYYCDLFLVIPAVLRIIGFSVTASYNTYLLLVNAFVIIVSNYSFRKITKNEYIAILMASLYSLSEIKFYQFTVKGTLGEGTALIFLPLVVLGLYQILYEENDTTKKIGEKDYHISLIKDGYFNLSIGYIGIICSHILSTEITLFVTLIFVILNIKKVFNRGVLLDFIKAILITALATLWFTIPFIESYILEDVNIKHSFARTIQTDGLMPFQLLINFFGIHSADKSSGIMAYEPVGLGIPIVLGMALFFGGIISSFIKKEKIKTEHYPFYVTSFTISILLIAFSIRQFPWDMIQSKLTIVAPLISSIQFPRRFLEWGTLLCIIILGNVIYRMKENKKATLAYTLIVFAIVGTLFSSVSRTDYNVATALKYPLGNFEGIRTDYVAGGEYMLYGTDQTLLKYSKIAASDGIIYSDYSSGALSAEVYVENSIDAEGYLELPLLNYRHYKAYVHSQQLRVVNGDNNVVRIVVPGGMNGMISVKYTPPVYWRLCEIVSLISIMWLVFYVINGKRRIKIKK